MATTIGVNDSISEDDIVSSTAAASAEHQRIKLLGERSQKIASKVRIREWREK